MSKNDKSRFSRDTQMKDAFARALQQKKWERRPRKGANGTQSMRAVEDNTQAALRVLWRAGVFDR